MASTGMMRRRIVLIKPAPEELNDVGEMKPMGEPTRMRVWSSWKETSGAESFSEEQDYGEDRIECDIWWNAAFRDIDIRWKIEDESGNELDLVSVTEMGGRRWQLRLKAARRI